MVFNLKTVSLLTDLCWPHTVFEFSPSCPDPGYTISSLLLILQTSQHCNISHFKTSLQYQMGLPIETHWHLGLMLSLLTLLLWPALSHKSINLTVQVFKVIYSHFRLFGKHIKVYKRRNIVTFYIWKKSKWMFHSNTLIFEIRKLKHKEGQRWLRAHRDHFKHKQPTLSTHRRQHQWTEPVPSSASSPGSSAISTPLHVQRLMLPTSHQTPQQ